MTTDELEDSATALSRPQMVGAAATTSVPLTGLKTAAQEKEAAAQAETVPEPVQREQETLPAPMPVPLHVPAQQVDEAMPEPTIAPMPTIAPVPVREDMSLPLLSDETATDLRDRWMAIQVSFVDGPGKSARSADALMREVIQVLLHSARARVDRLARTWEQTSDTEELRLALRDYRTFLDQVLLPPQ